MCLHLIDLFFIIKEKEGERERERERERGENRLL